MKFRLLLPFALIASLIACTPAKKEKENKPSEEVADTSSFGKKMSELNQKITADPRNPELLHERARLNIDQHNYKDALQDMNVVMMIDSTKSAYLLTMADLSFAANRSFAAKEFLEKALKSDSTNTEAMMRLAELSLIVKDYKQSVSILNKVISKDKSNTTALFMRGINYKENGDTTKAVSDFRYCIEADPNYYNAYMQLGIIYQAKNNPIAEGYFTNALKIRPSSEEALYGRGLWYQDHNDFDKAIQDYTTITQLNPKNKNAYFNLGYVHQIYLKVYSEAIKHYSKAIEADPKYAEAFYNRGLCYETIGDITDAASDYKDAMKIRPVYPAAEAGLKRVAQ